GRRVGVGGAGRHPHTATSGPEYRSDLARTLITVFHLCHGRRSWLFRPHHHANGGATRGRRGKVDRGSSQPSLRACRSGSAAERNHAPHRMAARGRVSVTRLPVSVPPPPAR